MPKPAFVYRKMNLGIFTYIAIISMANAQQEKQNGSNETAAYEVIEIHARKNQAYTEVSQPTKALFNIAGIASDPLAAVYSLPGVVYAGGDDGGEPAVRGSSPDDNAFYIDDIPVNYIFHLFGDSIFNENVIRDFDLKAAAFGSEYGNATGGIFDVQLRDPKNQDIQTTLEASMLKTGFFVEGGMSENQAFYFSYRRSLIHLFLNDDEEDGLKILKHPISDDYQGKYQWLIGDDQKLTVTLAGASDLGAINLSAASEEGRIDPDNIGETSFNNKFNRQSLSWQYFGDHNSVLKVVLGHSQGQRKEQYGTGQFLNLDDQEVNFRVQYGQDWLMDHRYFVGADWQNIDYDYQYDTIPYFCTEHTEDCQSQRGLRTQDNGKLSRSTAAVFAKNLWRINQDWQLEFGFRAERQDSTKQSFIHPRAQLTWLATNDLSLTAKIGTYSRLPNILNTFTKIGNPKLKAPQATHYVLGADYQLSDLWNTKVEVYYKDLSDLARVAENQQGRNQPLFTNDLSGSAYGTEWVIKREQQDGWYGWLSVSWSKSDRTDDITGKTTAYFLDTPLLANLVINYQLNPRWDFGLRWSVRSGQRYTPITGIRINPNHPANFLPVYGPLNSGTLPTYSRLDVQANYKRKFWGLDTELTFAILNATDSANISGYYYEPDDNDSVDNYTITGENGFEVFPSIGIKVTF